VDINWVPAFAGMTKQMWQVYILECADKTLYTGITVDLVRRLQEHNTSKLGAKYTKSRRPVKIVYAKKFRNRSVASIAESKIKKLSRAEKTKLIAA
jgi:putative endonuclease